MIRSPARANRRPREWATSISSIEQPTSARYSRSSARSVASAALASYRPTAAYGSRSKAMNQRGSDRGPGPLPRLAVQLVLVAVGAELLHLEPVGVVAPV